MSFQLKLPLFISFEGGEGCGKSTQIKPFHNWLEAEGIANIALREPGGFVLSEALRKIVLTGEPEKLTVEEELALFSASRCMFMHEVVRPALAAGQTVLTDRFADTTTVYQGYVGGLPEEEVNQFHQAAFRGEWPDITFYLDIPVEIGLARKGVQEAGGLDETRMEKKGHSFHDQVREGYFRLVKENPGRCVLIDASGTIDDVQQALRDAFLTKAQELGLLA